MAEGFYITYIFCLNSTIRKKGERTLKTVFCPNALPAWIGSLPLKDHDEALQLMVRHTPDIPLWLQLPALPKEGMVPQFLPGMPGIETSNRGAFINTDSPRFEGEFLAFFEEYVNILDNPQQLRESRFAITDDTAPGFSKFIAELDRFSIQPTAIKGQITGPFTFATGISDNTGKAIFYNDQIRDAAVKCIAMKARWQVNHLKKYNVPVILFFDEPALAGFGSSAFISVSRAEVDACLEEVISAVHTEGGLAGVHICANSEWPVILESEADIVSFDAYSYFDKFILYRKEVQHFLAQGGIIAWGIVPTGDIEAIRSETIDSLTSRFYAQLDRVEALGIKRIDIISKALITPSCGTGALPFEDAINVIRLTQEVSEKIRSDFFKI